MHSSKLPLTVWFWAAYLMATHSNGISALQLQRLLALGSYKSRSASTTACEGNISKAISTNSSSDSTAVALVTPPFARYSPSAL